MKHIVLLGDSIFDNAPYVPKGRDVTHFLRQATDPADKVTLMARDGAVTDGVRQQLSLIPTDATHLVLSVGGNDALGLMPLIEQSASTHLETLTILSSARSQFAQNYSNLVRRLKAWQLPLWLATIYAPPLQGALQVAAPAVLPLFNDSILSTAFHERLPVIDMRMVCNAPDDFVLDIEPSQSRGAKIAAAIAQAVKEEAARPVSRIYGRA